MSTTVNKYGLPRHIPSHIQAIIRKNDGYGCVKCGNIFIQYEHIDPLFCDAKEHNPEKITLLCSGCHDESTGKRLPKRIIQALKKDPYCKRTGFTKSKKFYPNPDQIKIKIGNSVFANTYVAISVHGKPILWVTKDFSDPYSPLLYSAIFMDSDGNKIGYLNKNKFIGVVGDCDFQAISNRIEVRSKKGEINLILEIEGDDVVEIKRLYFKYQNNTVRLNPNGSININTNTISALHIEDCSFGLEISSRPRQPSPLNALDSIFFINAKKIHTIFGKHSGFMFNNKIYDLKFGLVGVIGNQKVFNLFDEYIGELLEINETYIHIVMYESEYPDQEPIWISPKNEKFLFFQPALLIDTSYRLFGYSNLM